MPSNLRVHMCSTASRRRRSGRRADFAEFISNFFFVLAAVISTVSTRMLVALDVGSDWSFVVAIAIARAFGLFAALFIIAAGGSGGHVNSAVTFAFAHRHRWLAATAMAAPVVAVVAGACVLAAGRSALRSACIPARSFGLAAVSGRCVNQVIYWVALMIEAEVAVAAVAAAIAALVLQNQVPPSSAPEPPHGSVGTVVV